MRLNPDCIRDILLDVEETSGPRKYAVFVNLTMIDETYAFLGKEISETPAHQKALLDKYSCDELIYHVNYCAEAGLIKLDNLCSGDTIFVSDLSPAGHELLAKIRDSKHWGAIKNGLSAVRDLSLSAISSIAEGVTAAAINAYFSKLN